MYRGGGLVEVTNGVLEHPGVIPLKPTPGPEGVRRNNSIIRIRTELQALEERSPHRSSNWRSEPETE